MQKGRGKGFDRLRDWNSSAHGPLKVGCNTIAGSSGSRGFQDLREKG